MSDSCVIHIKNNTPSVETKREIKKKNATPPQTSFV